MGQGFLIEKKEGRYYKPCPECGEMQSYLRASYAKASLLLNKLCKKCSNRKTDNCHRGYYKCIPTTWFNKIKTSAELRNLSFSITIEQVYEKLAQNNFKCELSGMDLKFESYGLKHPASIDRIDSSVGYEIDNIQIVHKDVNFMKQRYSQEYFINVCKLIAKKNE